MKLRFFKYIIPALFLLGACQETEVDKLFNETPEARTAAEIARVKNDLIASELGWSAEYYYKDSTMHTTLVLDFKEDDRVVIKSVFDDFLEKESSYKMKYAQQFDLTFDSYSVLAFLMEETHYADFRWELESANEGEYKFISRADKSEGISYLTLKKADETTHTHLEEQRVIHSIRLKLVHNKEKSFFRNLRTDASPYGYRFSFNQYSDEATFFGVVDGALAPFTTKVIINGDGTVDLAEPLNIGGAFVKQFTYDEVNDAFIISGSDGVSGSVSYDNQPFITLKTADLFISFRFSYINDNSHNVNMLMDDIIKDMPGLITFQFYNGGLKGVLGVTDPAHDGTNKWDGFTGVSYEKLSDNLVYINATTHTFFRAWFEPVYNSNASLKKLYDEFFCSPDGMFVDIIDDKVYLISKTDPSLYVEVTKVN